LTYERRSSYFKTTVNVFDPNMSDGIDMTSNINNV